MRRWALAGGLVALAVLAGCGALGPTDASVVSFEPRVTVGGADPPALPPNATSTECTFVGPPPGHFSVTGQITLRRPPSRASSPDTFRVVVTVGNESRRLQQNVSLSAGVTERVQLYGIARSDGTLTAGERTTVRVRVRNDGATVARASKTLEVAEAAGCVEPT